MHHTVVLSASPTLLRSDRWHRWSALGALRMECLACTSHVLVLGVAPWVCSCCGSLELEPVTTVDVVARATLTVGEASGQARIRTEI